MNEQDQISRAVAEIMASRPTYRVGDRVRIRVNAECPRTREMETSAGVLDGQVGIVDQVREPQFRGGHYVGVRLERPVLGYHRAGVRASPPELELVESAASSQPELWP